MAAGNHRSWGLVRSELYRIEATFNPKTGEVTVETDAEMLERLTTWQADGSGDRSGSSPLIRTDICRVANGADRSTRALRACQRLTANPEIPASTLVLVEDFGRLGHDHLSTSATWSTSPEPSSGRAVRTRSTQEPQLRSDSAPDVGKGSSMSRPTTARRDLNSARSFSTNSRPALRAACGGRPRAGNHAVGTGNRPHPHTGSEPQTTPEPVALQNYPFRVMPTPARMASMAA